MPPDISACLVAPAAAPPGGAIGSGPAVPDPVSASLFAAFLAQSQPPGAKPPLPISLKTILTTPLKTMDTLPAFSFPPAPKEKDKASELLLSQSGLLLPQALIHHASGDTPADVLPAAVPPVQPTFLPPSVAANFVTPPQAVLAMPPMISAAPPVSFPAPAPAETSVPNALPASGTFVLPTPSTALSPAAPQAPAPAGAIVTQDPAPSLLPTRTLAPPVPTADALPTLASPVQNTPQQPDTQGQAVPVLTPATGHASPMRAALVQAIAQINPAPVAVISSPELVKPAPAKTAGKLGVVALKAAAGNADTSTRILQGQTATEIVAAKPAATALTLPPFEKHAPEHDKATLDTATDDGKSALPLTLPATVTDAAKPGAKPLSVGERAEVIKQAADGVGTMPLPAKPGETEQMSLQLHPKDWGRLEVSVTVVPGTEAGAAKTVSAHIVAETPQVKAALQSGTGALHDALRTSGLHLEHLTVSVKEPDLKPEAQNAPMGQPGNTSGQGSGFGTGQWQNNHRQPPPQFAPLLSSEPDSEDVPPIRIAARPALGRVDTHA